MYIELPSFNGMHGIQDISVSLRYMQESSQYLFSHASLLTILIFFHDSTKLWYISIGTFSCETGTS